MMKIPTIETKRLRLRAWDETDFEAYAQLNANKQFTQYIGSGNPLNRHDSWKSMASLIGHWHLKGFGLWCVELKDNSEFIGRVGLYEPEGWPSIEIDWGISPTHWGKGYATESALAALHWGFSQLDLNYLISIIQHGNQASVNVAERLGEKYDRDETIAGKKCAIYKISRHQYQTAHY